ncbi:MAG: Cephalosporin hydroxylase [Aeromicrobium sp.]|nr:Cephalosporin hydroxylase [Aeromicrobium sp.]
MIDRIDSLVLRRAATLLARAEHGLGRRAEDTRAVLAQAVSAAPDPAYVEAITPVFRAAWDRTSGEVYPLPELRETVVDQFHRLYYNAPWQTWQNTRYRGVLTAKCPLDLWIYHEIVHEVRPDVIIEAGTNRGGSALFLADQCDLVNNGLVVTIDIEDLAPDVTHPRIVKILGSSVSPNVHEAVLGYIRDGASVLVILDSDHNKAHVVEELRLWSNLVTPGSYLVVEDTDINGHPALPSFGPGPWEAVDDFLAHDARFVADREREKFMLTFNPRGFLRRI